MSTTNYSPSNSAGATEAYIRGKNDERGVAITGDVPGMSGAFSARARALTQNTTREVEALHYRQSFSDEEFDPQNPEHIQRVNDLGYLLAKKMHPNSDALVVTHNDGRGGKAHNHILVINHDNVTGKALSNYRSFYDRPDQGQQKGIQSANDELMREHGLSVAKELGHAPKDWELRREDFAEGSLDREMGDRMATALMDPRSVDKAGLEQVIAEQNTGDVPRMRLHTSVAKKGKNVGKETWSLYIQDDRGETNRAERRKRTSMLSADFTSEGAQALFDYHTEQQEQKEQANGRITQQGEAAGRSVELVGVDAVGSYERRGDRGSQRADEGSQRDEVPRTGGDRGDGQGGVQESTVDHAAIRSNLLAESERRQEAERARANAKRGSSSPERKAARRRLAEAQQRIDDVNRRSAEESQGYGFGD